MNDLISRQAALKICRKYWHPTFNPIMEEIEQLPSAQQWHTGEPTEDGDYLVFDTEEYYTVDAYYTHNGTEEYGTYLAYKGWQSCNHVKYWMPLPKLPEVEK